MARAGSKLRALAFGLAPVTLITRNSLNIKTRRVRSPIKRRDEVIEEANLTKNPVLVKFEMKEADDRLFSCSRVLMW
jgi:hypothetical protein